MVTQYKHTHNKDLELPQNRFEFCKESINDSNEK